MSTPAPFEELRSIIEAGGLSAFRARWSKELGGLPRGRGGFVPRFGVSRQPPHVVLDDQLVGERRPRDRCLKPRLAIAIPCVDPPGQGSGAEKPVFGEPSEGPFARFCAFCQKASAQMLILLAGPGTNAFLKGQMPAPKVFISFPMIPTPQGLGARSASALRTSGIDAVLDQWDLSPGQDIAAFMAGGIRTADRVLLICTGPYVSKAEAGAVKWAMND